VRVRKDKGWRESAKDNISELDTPWRDNVTESEVVFAKKFREIVKENKEKSKGAAVEASARELQVRFFQER
jgi:hypothetical protein